MQLSLLIPPTDSPSRLRLVRVPALEPAIRYQTAAEAPATCPRPGCGGLLREFRPGRLCSACARVFVIEEELRHTRGRQVRE